MSIISAREACIRAFVDVEKNFPKTEGYRKSMNRLKQNKANLMHRCGGIQAAQYQDEWANVRHEAKVILARDLFQRTGERQP